MYLIFELKLLKNSKADYELFKIAELNKFKGEHRNEFSGLNSRYRYVIKGEAPIWRTILKSSKDVRNNLSHNIDFLFTLMTDDNQVNAILRRIDKLDYCLNYLYNKYIEER